MGVSPTDLHDLAVEFLTACEEALDTVPTYAPELGGAPARAFVSPGAPVFDCCDQLAVYVSVVSERTYVKGSGVNDVQLVATATRCTPVPDSQGNPPSTADMQASAEQLNADKWALWNHLHALILAGELFERCCEVRWGLLTTINPLGGCAGSSLTITVCFDGYESALGT